LRYTVLMSIFPSQANATVAAILRRNPCDKTHQQKRVGWNYIVLAE
jgi:hypothetical protein